MSVAVFNQFVHLRVQAQRPQHGEVTANVDRRVAQLSGHGC